MTGHKPFIIKNINSVEEFADVLRLKNLNIPIAKDFSVLNRPLRVDHNVLYNALATNPLEGEDAFCNGSPSSLTYKRYEKLINGGPGMIWFESCAYTQDGKSNMHQLHLHQESMPGLKSLVDFIDRSYLMKYGFKPYKILQLSHAGRASRDENNASKPLTAFANPIIDKYYDGLQIVSDDYIEWMEDQFVNAAVLAKECGFDAIDLKLCHNYIQHEFLSAFTRKGKYGGSFENRTRFVMNVIDKIKKRLGNELDLTARLNVYDSMGLSH